MLRISEAVNTPAGYGLPRVSFSDDSQFFLLLKFIVISHESRKTTTNFMILLIQDFLAKDLHKNIAKPTLVDFIFLI